MAELLEGDRPTLDESWFEVAEAIAHRGTCARRQVGCVLTDRLGRILSTGYNGRPRGWLHCRGHGPTVVPCAGATAAPGEKLDLCEAIHAEQNALLQCHDVAEIFTAYCTTLPCVTCAKLLLNTGCKRVLYHATYPQADEVLRLFATGQVEVIRVD